MTAVVLARRLLLGLPLALAACGDETPVTFAPLRYDYLTPLRLNVATMEVGPAPIATGLAAQSPVAPGSALRQMLEDRLSAAGSSGRAVVTIDEASIQRQGDALNGAMAVTLEIVSASGSRAGYAEAKVIRRVTGTSGSLRPALYEMTKQMLEDMNVELEFQLRRSLRDYLQAPSTAAAPAPVTQQPLGAPAR